MGKKVWCKLEYAIHPGEILKEYLEDENITQIEVSKKTGLNKTIINEIISGKRSITTRTAILLEKVFSFKASFWINLQMIYDETNERIKLSHESVSTSISLSIRDINDNDEKLFVQKFCTKLKFDCNSSLSYCA